MNPKEFKPLIISAALTGAIPTKEAYPRLPIEPREIADQACECHEAGAAIVHVHVRDREGRQVQDPDLFWETIGLIRAEKPDLIICATTTSRGSGDPDDRVAALTLPEQLLPDMASLTLGSYNTPHGVNINPAEHIEFLAHRMREVGVAPEVEIFEFGMIETLARLIDARVLPDKLLANILLGVNGASPAKSSVLANMVQALPASVEWAAAGIGHFQKTVTAVAVAMGGNVRVGMEDDPRGDREDWSNVDAVLRIRKFADALDRQIATPDEVRARLGLTRRLVGP